MMGIQTYRTREMAKLAITTLHGWDAKPVHIYVADDYAAVDANARRRGPHWLMWVIECEPGKYLRTDGYVR